MILAALHQVDKHYGEQTVLRSAHLELRPGDRWALIGRNGAGKTTVLRLLLGQESADGGDVYLRPGVRVAALEQDLGAAPGATVLDLAEAAFADLEKMERDLAGLEAEGLDDPERYARWEALHEVFERRGGYARRARRDAVLHALGFAGREGDVVSRLSGGERTRLGLSRVLMAQPDVLLLDEPTNHLDMAMRDWLVGFVARYPGSAILVSHDRAFLDGASDRTAEVDRGELRSGQGNPSQYREARAEQARIEARTRVNQLKEHDRLSEAATQMRRWAGQSEKLHRRARAMERRVERMEEEMLPEERRAAPTTRFTFPCPPSVDVVLHAKHLSARYGRSLFQDVELLLRRGERVAVVGPNGAGKTTLLRILMGQRDADDPRAQVAWGTRVRVAYYDQDLSGVDPEATLVQELVRWVGEMQAHDLLGRFMFPYAAQFKRVADLSGGERARLALLKLSLTEANVLVLDEPTNHLDVEMIEALEAALQAYEGTVILVSHDRRFLHALATRVWEVEAGALHDYEGDWGFYQRKRAERREAEQAAVLLASAAEASGRSPSGQGREKGRPSAWRLRQDRDRIEVEVAELEQRLSEVRAALVSASGPGGDVQALAELGHEHDRLEQALLTAMAAWEATETALADGVAGDG